MCDAENRSDSPRKVVNFLQRGGDRGQVLNAGVCSRHESSPDDVALNRVLEQCDIKSNV